MGSLVRVGSRVGKYTTPLARKQARKASRPRRVDTPIQGLTEEQRAANRAAATEVKFDINAGRQRGQRRNWRAIP